MTTLRTTVLRMVGEHFPQLLYGHPRTYRVAAVRGDLRLDLVPLEDAQHLPELDAVEQWGLGKVTPTVGTDVVVVFRDASAARPVVVGWAHDSVPSRIDLCEDDDAAVVDPTGRVVRYGDSISVPVVGAVATGPVAVAAPPGSASRVRT